MSSATKKLTTHFIWSGKSYFEGDSVADLAAAFAYAKLFLDPGEELHVRYEPARGFDGPPLARFAYHPKRGAVRKRP